MQGTGAGCESEGAPNHACADGDMAPPALTSLVRSAYCGALNAYGSAASGILATGHDDGCRRVSERRLQAEREGKQRTGLRLDIGPAGQRRPMNVGEIEASLEVAGSHRTALTVAPES